MYPQQPSNDPNQGGQYQGGRYTEGQYPGDQYPPGQYPQDPAYYGGHPGSPAGAGRGNADGMPGTAVTVRVLMFIGGAFGLLFGGLMWLVAAMAASGGQIGEQVRRALEDTGMAMSGAEAATFFGVMGAVPFVYGIVSIVLASLMGRRSPVILWAVVVFQVLAALVLVVNLFTGGFAAVIPLLFTIAMIVLMLLGSTRAYYSRSGSSH
jgi:hypothetical protein